MERYFTVRDARIRPTARRDVYEVHTEAELEHLRVKLGTIERVQKGSYRWADVQATLGRSGKLGTAGSWGEAVEALKQARKEG